MQTPVAHPANQPAPALTAALTVTLALLTCPGAAAERSFSYDIAYGNVALGEATLQFNDDGAHYQINMTSRSRGPLDNLLRWQAEAESTGRSAGTAFRPEMHHWRTDWRGNVRTVTLHYDTDGMTVVAAEPPEPVRKSARLQALAGPAALDPYSAALLLLRDLAAGNGCDRHLRIFDGRKIRDVETRSLGRQTVPADRPWSYRGKATTCRLIAQEVALDEAMDENAGQQVTVWFADLGTAGWAPVRVEIPLLLGSLTARLLPTVP